MGTATVVAYCRAGFEGEVGVDLRRIAARCDVSLEIDATAAAAHVIARATGFDAGRWSNAQAATPPIFARSVFMGFGPVALLADPKSHTRADRVTPLLAAIAQLPNAAASWRNLWIEFPDTNEGKALSPLARALAARVEGELSTDVAASRRMHVFLPDGATAYVGTSNPGLGSPWPMGIPRLRMPRAAPSRSTLKLAEAIVFFLGEREASLLRPGLRAVDLGAAPGGWTWQLAQRGLRVTAVDNGSLKGTMADDPLVTHLREDGMSWRPKRAVDWLVCDMVEQPLRCAELVARWIADGAARHAIFNLKLPMKRRYDEVRRCEQRIGEIMQRARLRHTLRIQHLYHDREEVTAYLARAD